MSVLLNYMDKREVPREYPQGIVELVDFVVAQIPHGLEDDWIRQELGDDFSHTAAVLKYVSKFRGKASTYPSLVRLVGRVLDEINSDFVTLEFANRLFIQALQLEADFEQARRADGIWLVDGLGLRRSGYLVELKQEFDYQAIGFSEPLDEDVLKLL